MLIGILLIKSVPKEYKQAENSESQDPIDSEIEEYLLIHKI